MKKRFLILIFLPLFIAAAMAVSPTVKAEGIGSSCAELGAKKKSCGGNTLVTIKCSYPADCPNSKSSDCMSAQLGCDAECRKLDKCYSSELCKPDPNLSGALQYSYVDKVYANCINDCKDKVRSCYLACNNTRVSCERADEAKKAEYKKCMAQYKWEKYDERLCDSGTQCIQSGDNISCAQTSNPANLPNSTNNGDNSFNDYLACILAETNNNQANSNDECERKYGVKLPKNQSGQPVPAGDQSAPTEEKTPLGKAKILDGDLLRDFVYGLSFDETKDLFTEENRQIIGVSQWAKLVKASEDIRRLRQNAFALGRGDLRELSLYLESNSLASWERAAVNEAIDRVKNNRPSLPPEDFFPEPRLIEDFRNKSRGDYAEEVIKRNEEIARRSDLISLEHQRIMDALNSELGMSPLRQGLLDQERKQKQAFIEAGKPDPAYTGLDFEVPFDTSLQGDTPQPPVVSGRGRNPEPMPAPERFIQVARISNFEGRVYIVRTERDGSKTYETLRRIGTSINPAVIFNDDKIIVGQDSLVDIIRPNGNENRYIAPEIGKDSTGDEINTEVKQVELQPPDPKLPPPNPILKWLGDFFERSIPEEETFETPWGVAGVKN